MAAAEARMPAVSQVGSSPRAGGVGKMQRRQGVRPGTMPITRPSVPTRPGIDPRQISLDGEVIDEISRLDIVRAVEDELVAIQQLLDIGRAYVNDQRLDGDG